MTGSGRRQATVVLGLLLSWPAYRTWSAGGIELDTLAIRFAVAMVAAFVAVSAVASVIRAYAPPEGPPVEEDATGDEVERLPLADTSEA